VYEIARMSIKQSKELLIQLRKLGLEFILLTLLYFEKHDNILSLIDIDVHIKFIYIDSSHIYKNSLSLQADVDSN